MVHEIDQAKITKDNSPFSFTSSYYIDNQANNSAEQVLLKADFINSEFGNIPFTITDKSYWIKLTLQYPIHNTLFSSARAGKVYTKPNYFVQQSSEAQSSAKKSSQEQIILMAEHSMLQTFEVYRVNNLSLLTLIYAHPSLNQDKSKSDLTKNVYPYTPLTLNGFGQSEFLIHLKNSGPPNVSLLLFKPQDFEQRLMLSQLLYGAFIGLFLIIAIYNLVLYFNDKDKVYLLSIGYLLSTFGVLASLTGFGHFLFPYYIMQVLQHHVVFISFIHLIILFSFTIYFLRYDRLKHWAFKYAKLLAVMFILTALYSLFINELIQAKIFFLVQTISYIAALLLISNRFKKDFSWAHFYFLSWLPLLIGSVIQALMVFDLLEYSFLTRHAFLFAVMAEIAFITFALSDRIRHNEKEKFNTLAYHQSSHIPRKTNLDFCIAQLLAKKDENLTVVIIKPEQFDQIYLHIDVRTRHQFFSNIYLKLSSLFALNNAVVAITSRHEKLCLIENLDSSHSLAMVVNNKENKQDISALVKSIQAAVSEVYYLQELKISLSACVGLASYPEHGTSSDILIENASYALNYAELTHTELDHTKWAFFDIKSGSELPSSMQLVIDLQHAILEKSFEVYHQPQIDLKTNKVCSSECLIRWNHPILGFVAPDVFIPMAEDFGFMPSLSLWVIETALHQQVILTEQTGFNHMVSINISIKDLIQTNFVDSVSDIIDRIDIKAEKVIFELTAFVALSKNEQALKTIAALTALGITVSINDFDFNYSATSKTSQLFFQELKINQDFIENIISDKKSRMITAATIKVAKTLKLEVVAEGINSVLDEEIVRKFGCDISQGHYYAKAMSHTDYLDWLTNLNNGQIPASIEGEFIPAGK